MAGKRLWLKRSCYAEVGTFEASCQRRPAAQVIRHDPASRDPLSSRNKCNTCYDGVTMGEDYGQLSLEERIEIYRLHAAGKSQRAIAMHLGRAASTISRELRRNSVRTKAWPGVRPAPSTRQPDRHPDLLLRCPLAMADRRHRKCHRTTASLPVQENKSQHHQRTGNPRRCRPIQSHTQKMPRLPHTSRGILTISPKHVELQTSIYTPAFAGVTGDGALTPASAAAHRPSG